MNSMHRNNYDKGSVGEFSRSQYDSASDQNVGLATPFVNIQDVRQYRTSGHKDSQEFPTNPLQYLHNVMKEAESYPDVIVAAKPIRQSKTTDEITDNMNEPTPEVDYQLSKSWSDDQLTIFFEAREHFTRHMASLKSISRQTKKRPKLPVYPLPAWEDERNWFYFCFGNKNASPESLARRVTPTPTQQKQDKNLNDDDKDERIIELSSLKEGFPPMMRILLRMDMNQIEANLEYQFKWLSEYGFSHQQGRWIYALLSALQKPLYPTVVSIIRDIARKCKELRRMMYKEEQFKSQVFALNIIICVVSIYFNQTDLMDSYHVD